MFDEGPPERKSNDWRGRKQKIKRQRRGIEGNRNYVGSTIFFASKNDVFVNQMSGETAGEETRKEERIRGIEEIREKGER